MAAVEDEVDDKFKDIDIETLLSRVERRPLTFNRKKSVFIAPEFTQRLKGEETVDEGSDLTLNFKVNGVPRPTLRWFKDDEEVKDHARLTVEEGEDGRYTLTLHQVNKGDSAAYRCRAENSEGACSCCFFLSVKGKPKSPKRDSKKNTHKRTVSFPTMFSTIVEKVEEEESAGKEASKAAASPLTPFYDSITLKGRLTWQEFLGDWAFVNGGHKARGGSTGSYTSTGSEAESPRDPDDVVRIFADAEGWEPDDVFLDSPAEDGQVSLGAHLAQAPDVVLFLQAAEERTHGVRAVPAHAHRAPEEPTSRGTPGQLLTKPPPVIGQQLKDSKEVSPGGGKGVSSSLSSSPVSSSPAQAATPSAFTPVKAGGSGKVLPSSSGGNGSGQAVIKDKAKQSALPAAADKKSTSSPSSPSSSSSSPPSLSAPSSSVVTKPTPSSRVAPSQAKSASDVSQKNTSASSRGVSGAAKSKAEPAKKAATTSTPPVGPPGGFSLSTESLAAKDGSARPVSVRGPLGALISPGGDAAKKTPSRGPSTTKKASLTTTTVVTSTSSRASPAPEEGPTVTLTPSSAAPSVVVVTPDSQQQQQGKADKMCDINDPMAHVCHYSSSSGTNSSADRSGTTITTVTTTTTTLHPQRSHAPSKSPSPGSLLITPLSPVSSSAPSSGSSLGQGLLEVEYDREEREPTPIPPDRLIVTHTPTGNSVLVQMYKGNIHPPVHPVPARAAARKGEAETEKEKDKRKDQTETEKDKRKDEQDKEKDKPDRREGEQGNATAGQGTTPVLLVPEEKAPLKEHPHVQTSEGPAFGSGPRRVVSMPARTDGLATVGGKELKQETLAPTGKKLDSLAETPQKSGEHLPPATKPLNTNTSQTQGSGTGSQTGSQPQPSPTEANRPFIKRPGENVFTRTSTDPNTPAATEALYFDPVHQELVHLKQFNPDPEPARSRSAILEPSRGKWGTREPPRRSPSPSAKQREREKRARGKLADQQRVRTAGSAGAVYASIASDPEKDLVYQYFRELAFVLCLLTFLGLLFKIRPHVFVVVVLGVHLALFFSRKYIFVRKPTK